MYFDMYNDVNCILKTPRGYVVFGANHTKEFKGHHKRLIELILKIYTQTTVKQKNI